MSNRELTATDRGRHRHHGRKQWWKRAGSIIAAAMLTKSHPEW